MKLTNENLSRSFWRLTILSFLVVFIASCTNEEVVKDPFFETWKTKAMESKGYSPSPIPKHFEIPEEEGVKEITGAKDIRLLSTEKVELNLRKADVKSVLLSLARIIDLNMIIKSELEGQVNVDFKDVPWGQAFKSILRSQGLSYMWEGEIIQVMTIEDLERDLALTAINEKRNALLMGEKRAEPLLTTMINIDYAEPRELMENFNLILTRDDDGKPLGEIRIDEHSNSLIIHAIRDDIEKMISLVNAIDIPTAQILIKANIVETTKGTARDLGIQWGGMVREGDMWLTPGGTGGTLGWDPREYAGDQDGQSNQGGQSGQNSQSDQYKTGVSGHGFGVNFPVGASAISNAGGLGTLGLLFGVLNGDILEVQLQALQASGVLNILSSPSITTLDNQMAFTENGEKIPFVSTATSGGASTQNVQFVDAVLRLEITPHVIGESLLKMKIMVQKDEVDPSRNVQGNPYIIKKETETVLVVQNGETIVISGLTKQTIAESSVGIPVLKDLPVLGRLFRGESKRDDKVEVLIFITPHILPTREFARAHKQPGGATTHIATSKGVVEGPTVLEKQAAHEEIGGPIVEDKLDTSIIQEGPDELDVQDGPIVQEELIGPIVQDELDTSIVHEGPDELIGSEK